MLDEQHNGTTILHTNFNIPQVKLGFVKLVASITSQCVRQDRPDAVAKASAYVCNSVCAASRQQPANASNGTCKMFTHGTCTGRRCLLR